ncbi:MAG TPA: pyruvate dehydrogenase (acetyl-transferring) E1 component subunit alpha [Gammaproteobacteria bacterium]|nr:pyruvate dehydrogenase (acetyl-transferring) E1 component subunit alpha [Gammaproteobacteria bacterium]
MRRPADASTLRLASDTPSSELAAQFEVRYTRILDPDGRARAPLPEPFSDPRALTSLYEEMLALRLFDAKAVALQRTGRLGTYPSCLGQEATAIAIGRTMAREDVMLATYRETGTMLARGVRMAEILLYWSGDERGSAYSGPDAPKEDFPICVPIATHAPQAVGVAYSMKLKREPRVAVCIVGDGATSKGDFYEALNGAGVWQLPLVFVVVNNEWAISVPRSAQTHAQTLAQKAIAAGIPGEQVDGNDVLAMHSVMQRALASARRGGGPTVIEALTYRLADHTTADDATRYRNAADLERARSLDPLVRLRQYLVRERLWSEPQEIAAREACNARVEQAVAEFLATPPREPTAMFEHLFAELPASLHEQRDAVRGRDHE